MRIHGCDNADDDVNQNGVLAAGERHCARSPLDSGRSLRPDDVGR